MNGMHRGNSILSDPDTDSIMFPTASSSAEDDDESLAMAAAAAGLTTSDGSILRPGSARKSWSMPRLIIDSPSAFNFDMDTIRLMLKCVGCTSFLFPPIMQCVAGHMICKPCYDVKPECGKCNGKVIEVPAKFAESVTEQFKVQCSYWENGCGETIPFKFRRAHEEMCLFKPVQCPEFDCHTRKLMGEMLRHFRLEHSQHFVNARGNVFKGDIRCDDSIMAMGVERKWAPTMMRLETPIGGQADGTSRRRDSISSDTSSTMGPSQPHHFFLEIMRTKHGVWHMWVWLLGETDEAKRFRCEIALKRKGIVPDGDGGGGGGAASAATAASSFLKYSGAVHSIRVAPQNIILSGCLLSFSDYVASHFRHTGSSRGGPPVIDYRVEVSEVVAPTRSKTSEKMSEKLRRLSIDGGKAIYKLTQAKGHSKSPTHKDRN